MAEWLVSSLTEKLTEKIFDIGSTYLKDQIRWQTGMKDELERLQENQDEIRAVLSAAIRTQNIDQNTKLNNWIWRLRDAFDEVEDVLDDFEYMEHKKRLTTNMAHSTMSSFKKIGKRALKIDPLLKRVEEVVHKLDQISAKVSTFRDLLKDTQQEQKVQQDKLQNDRETGSMPGDVLIGQDKAKKSIIQWLEKQPNEDNTSLLSIVGQGGMGKTTLLQHIYKEKVTEKFDLKMWICVSNNFDVKEVIKSMLESLTKERPKEELLDTLQNNLQSKVAFKKFLLVLDDIWEENEVQDKIKWEKIFSPLKFGGLGSKILITTRMKSAASIIAKVINKKNELLILEGLEMDECLQLLNNHAFAGVDNSSNDFENLRLITEELVKKLNGSPLAAKVIGGVLNTHLDKRHWENISNNVSGYNDMLPILKLSYTSLPEYLQNCFAFCSIFAQDHVFDEDDLVRMWIAVGFIQPSNIQGEDLEDIGRRYIDDLVKKSLFEKDAKGYKMHDLLHDLAKSVSAHECFKIVGDEDSVLNIPPRTIRHLFVTTTNFGLLKKLGKFKNLRTLFIEYGNGRNIHYFVDVLPKIFKETRSIRLLSIDAYGKKLKLKAIGCLKHLRYLKIDFGGKFRLPRSISNLFHLQFLICNHIYNIPRDMNNLSNLRYSNLPVLYKCPRIGKLKFLHELDGLVVKNKTGYRIGELEHMHDLRILQIKGLENVKNVEEARKAKLGDKKKLTDLSLEWYWNVKRQDSPDLDRYARVLDNLQPHNNLKELTLSNYMGVRSAIWMNNVNNSINNLEHIILKGCSEWQNLPPFGQLPSLKSLHLEDMPKAVRFDMHSLFPSLEELCIEGLEALEDWFDAGVDGLFSHLTELYLDNCPNLKELPYLPPKLKKLRINKIGWKTLNYCSSISKSTLLETLKVRHCPNITIIPLTSEIIDRSAKIEIVNCPKLLSLEGHQEVHTTENSPNLIISDPSVLQMEPLRSVTSIRDNDGLLSFPFEAKRWFLQGSSSLCTLFFTMLKSLQSLPSSLTSLSSLKKLMNLLKVGEIDNLDCPNLILDSLTISDPSVLRMEPLRSVTSIKELIIMDNDGLASFSFEAEWWFSSLRHLKFENLKSLQSLPSFLTSLSSLESLSKDDVPQPQLQQSSLSALSSLNKLELSKIPLLKSLPDLPPSLCSLNLWDLDKLDCLPSCLSSLSSLTSIEIYKVPLLRELPDLPPSLRNLKLEELDKLDRLPSCLSSLSSLTFINIDILPSLRELPNLPPSLCSLNICHLDKLDCLPSCLSSLSSLTAISIEKVPLLRELPDLPPSVKYLRIQNCNPKFMKRYKSFYDLR